ncbi:MAG TPA: DUF6807 family protein [Prolixibacteraceae bacterium]|nr:DUF6807 family protein [Prolixibacteraceae bacterium]
MTRYFTLILFLLIAIISNAQIHMKVEKGGFLFLEGKDSIFFYQKSPKDINGQYSRCNYIHPLYGLDNTRLTEDFPADHLHHRGVFWAWHQILINGQSVGDGWELKNFLQKVSDVEFQQKEGKGILNTTVEWKSPLYNDMQDAYLKEFTTITMFPKTSNYRRIDFEITLKAIADHLSIGGSEDEKGYSGFSVRLKLPQDISFYDEKGLVEPANTAISAGRQMKMEGAMLKNGNRGGVVIYSDPSNPSPSTQWILRKSASMQNAAFPGREPVAIPVDKPLKLKYSLLVYQGSLNAKQIRKAVK